MLRFPPEVTFRAKLLAAFVLAVVLSVGLVAWTVSSSTRRAFEQLDSQRTAALVAQFQREFARRGQEIALRVQGMADAEATLRMAIDLARAEPDYSLYVGDARSLAASMHLDYVELVAHDETIVSSAHRPNLFLHRHEWFGQPLDWQSQGPFLTRIEFPSEVPVVAASDGAQAAAQPSPAPKIELAIVAVRTVGVGEKKLYVIGGQRLDRQFLASLVLPAGMRALLYQNLSAAFDPASLSDASGPVSSPANFAALIDRVRMERKEITDTLAFGPDPARAESISSFPLAGRDGELLGVLLVGSSRRELAELDRFIGQMALVSSAVGILLGLVVSWWASARVTSPVRRLAEGARAVAAGNWSTRVETHSRDEIGELGKAFNRMTQQLSEQRERLLQAERVAAWRELARRLAHELKNPLFPLQITIENLEKVRAQRPEQFEEVFRESTATLLAELNNLKTIIGRFSDFAKMPAPQPESINLNHVVREVLRLFDAQFNAVGRPPVNPEVYLQEDLPEILADPSLLTRALQNLVLNALDAMPSGGTLTIRTRALDSGVRLEIADTGTGLTKEECERLFTPYYTTRQHGTGLGLAIVQSVVSDHGGKISVESEPGSGSTFRIDLPDEPPSQPSGGTDRI